MRTARAAGTLAATIIALGAPAGAAAAPRVALHAGFTPDRAGASTTISLGFTVAEPTPVRGIQITLPPGMGFATATLGFATCDPATFTAEGANACPADSRVGQGTAHAEAQFSEGGRLEPAFENAKVETFFGPIEGEAQTVLLWVAGYAPVYYWLPLIARALPTGPAHSERLSLEVPLLLAGPTGPTIALRDFTTTIGPEHITYYLHQHGRAIPFKPHGLSVPERCPHGGYPVRASFSWWQSSGSSNAITRIPCPGRAGRPRRRGGGYAHGARHGAATRDAAG